jgi:hypothetical protein
LKGILTSWVSVTKTRNIPWRSSWQMDSTCTNSSNWRALLSWRWRSLVSLLERWTFCLTTCQSMINTWAVPDSTLLWWPCLVSSCIMILCFLHAPICFPELAIWLPNSIYCLFAPKSNSLLPKSTICLTKSTICPIQSLSSDSPLSKWPLS